MLINDFGKIGNKLYDIRKKSGLSRVEVAEKAGLSDRTYADIERGSTRMKTDTLLQICEALHITPNDILMEENLSFLELQENILEQLNECSPREKETALQLLSVYLHSLKK